MFQCPGFKFKNDYYISEAKNVSTQIITMRDLLVAFITPWVEYQFPKYFFRFTKICRLIKLYNDTRSKRSKK